MKFLKLSAIMTLALVAHSAMAANWVKLDAGSKKNKETTYLDLDNIQSNYDHISIWLKVDIPTDKKLPNGKAYRQMKVKQRIDCKGKRYATDQEYDYTSKGNLVHSYTTYDSWHDVIPDTGGEVIIKEVCAYAKI